MFRIEVLTGSGMTRLLGLGSWSEGSSRVPCEENRVLGFVEFGI